MKLSLTYITILFVLVSCKISNAQKTFMGTITYDITYDGSIDAAMKAQLPSEQIASIKGGKVMQEMKSSMGTQSSYMDSEGKTGFVLIDMMGQQFAIKLSKEDVEKQLKETASAKVEFLEETKTIAGHKCKKAEVTEGENTVTFYYATDINAPEINWGTPYKDIKGMVLEYSMSMQGINAKYVAKEVKETKVKDSKFAIPSGYKEMTSDEAKKMFGGGE